MIAADTSAWIDFAKGIASSGARKLELCLFNDNLVMPLPVLHELLSGPGMTKDVEACVKAIPRLELDAEFWERAAKTRRKLLSKGLKARAMDCLIAQSCIDHGTPLIANDGDFRHFIKSGLKLV